MDVISNKYINNSTSNDTDYTYKNSDGLFLEINTREGRIFLIANIFCILYFFIPLISLIPFRNWYIVRQRNFILTFIGGIANFLSTFSNLVTRNIKLPCGFTYYLATVATFIVQICYVARALRLILLHELNVFKVTQLTKDKFVEKSKNGAIVEPNFYYKSLYKVVDKKIVQIVIPVICIVEMILCIIVHVSSGNYCGFTEFIDINTAIISYAKSDKTNSNGNNYGNMKAMFAIPQIIGIAFTALNFIIAVYFMFADIRDDQRFGVKFDCFSNALVSFIINTLYLILKANEEKIMRPDKKRNVSQVLVNFYEVTKGGILLYVLVGFYIHTASVVIPWIKCIKAKRLEKKYENEPTNSMEYFYNILNSPNLVEELKIIALQEFSVENVLFWENYCILQKIVSRVKHKQENIGENSSNSHQKLSVQDFYSQNSNSHDSESYDPNYPLLPQLLPYYNSFYHTFIDIEGPAPVNITGDAIRRIYHGFYTYPTVGIFDEAKDEVVEAMYFSIFPILLQQNRKQLGDLFSH